MPKLTKEDLTLWNLYKSKCKTVFLDFDGVCVNNGSQYFSPKWGETKPLMDNFPYLLRKCLFLDFFQ